MSKILVGTASWTDKSLIASARFYPPKCNTPEERLRFYGFAVSPGQSGVVAERDY